MLTSNLKAAGKVLATLCLAVFFADCGFSADSSLHSLETGMAELVYSVSRSVVTVEASKPINGSIFDGVTEEAIQKLISSGLILDTTGHIIAAASSIAGREQIMVRFEGELIPARVIGTDYQAGLALLKVDRRLGVPVEFAQQYSCAGQMVVAMGNALGLRACPSIGFCAGFRPDGVMQFSAPVTPGTIGGGLFDLSGRLVGAITDGICQGHLAEAGLAVPVHKIPSIVERLRVDGDRMAGYVGISTADIEILPAMMISLPNRLAASNAGPYGVVIERATIVTNVVRASPAARAGLRKGDLLFAINNVPVNSACELMAEVRRAKPNNIIELSFIRQNNPYFVRLKVSCREPTPAGHFASETERSDRRMTITDSLYSEIRMLKRAISSLENRLKKLAR